MDTLGGGSLSLRSDWIRLQKYSGLRIHRRSKDFRTVQLLRNPPQTPRFRPSLSSEHRENRPLMAESDSEIERALKGDLCSASSSVCSHLQNLFRLNGGHTSRPNKLPHACGPDADLASPKQQATTKWLRGCQPFASGGQSISRAPSAAFS